MIPSTARGSAGTSRYKDVDAQIRESVINYCSRQGSSITGANRNFDSRKRADLDRLWCEARLTMLNVRWVGLSLVQVPPAMPVGEMLLPVDLIELARAIDRHWLPRVCDTSLDVLLGLSPIYSAEEPGFSAQTSSRFLVATCLLISRWGLLVSIIRRDVGFEIAPFVEHARHVDAANDINGPKRSADGRIDS